jgi:hypothetical protein
MIIQVRVSNDNNVPDDNASSGRVANARLIVLLYELLDAHDDTARLTAGQSIGDGWRAHVEYLRQLQRVGRELLAAAAGCPAGVADLEGYEE